MNSLLKKGRPRSWKIACSAGRDGAARWLAVLVTFLCFDVLEPQRGNVRDVCIAIYVDRNKKMLVDSFLEYSPAKRVKNPSFECLMFCASPHIFVNLPSISTHSETCGALRAGVRYFFYCEKNAKLFLSRNSGCGSRSASDPEAQTRRLQHINCFSRHLQERIVCAQERLVSRAPCT